MHYKLYDLPEIVKQTLHASISMQLCMAILPNVEKTIKLISWWLTKPCDKNSNRRLRVLDCMRADEGQATYLLFYPTLFTTATSPMSVKRSPATAAAEPSLSLSLPVWTDSGGARQGEIQSAHLLCCIFNAEVENTCVLQVHLNGFENSGRYFKQKRMLMYISSGWRFSHYPKYQFTQFFYE